MPEGTIIGIMLVFVMSAAACMVAYCLWLAQKYRKITADMCCMYEGTMHQVIEIVYDADDWFMRKVRLHTGTYPYVVEVLISDVRTIPRGT